MGVAYFGLIVHLNAEKTLLFFSLLVVGLILFDQFLEYIDHYAHAVKFGKLIDKVYKEMMTMGFIGFVIFITFNAFSLEHDENYLAFEFAHIIIFFMTIVAVFRALFVIFVSNRTIKGFWRAQNQDCGRLLGRYRKTLKEFTLESVLLNYFPIFSNLYRDIEYKLMKDYFYEDFKIRRDEFQFLDYLSMSNKLYAIEMTEISPFSWAFICVLATLNFLRIKLNFHCHNDINRRLAGEEDDGAELKISAHCAEYITLYFLGCGFLAVLFGTVVCLFTWKSKMQLMKIASGGSSNYEAILEHVMGKENRSEELMARRQAALVKKTSFDGGETDPDNGTDAFMSAEDDDLEGQEWHVGALRQVMTEHSTRQEEQEKKRAKELVEKLDVLGIYAKYKSIFVHTNQEVNIVKMAELREKRKLYHYEINSKLPLLRADSMGGRPSGRWFQKDFSVMGGFADGTSGRISARMCGNSGRIGGDSERFSGGMSGRIGGGSERFSGGMSGRMGGGSMRAAGSANMLLRQTSMKNRDVVLRHGSSFADSYRAFDNMNIAECDESESDAVHPLLFELDQVFILGSRSFFKVLVELFQISNALFIAMWLTNFAFITMESHHPRVYTGVTILAIFAMLYMLSFIQFHATCLLAVTSLQNEATDWICEQDIMRSELLPRLRDELLKLLDDGENFAQEMETLFDLVKDKNNEGIGLKQFHAALQTLNFYTTDDEVGCLFRSMDLNGSGFIDLAEFKELLQGQNVGEELNKVKAFSTD